MASLIIMRPKEFVDFTQLALEFGVDSATIASTTPCPFQLDELSS